MWKKLIKWLTTESEESKEMRETWRWYIEMRESQYKGYPDE